MATVRTPEGSARFDQPIGAVVGEKSPLDASPSPPRVSSVRLRSLRAMILDKMAIGDEAAAQELTEKFRAEYAIFAKGKSPAEVERELTGPQ